MLNEWQEFLDYTGPVAYHAVGKQDATWLGRFTLEALRDFSGLSRILTIQARGFLFHSKDGGLLPGEPRERIETARRALCTWCSVPGQQKKDWQYQTDFAPLHEEFPELMDEEGKGWFCRHFHRAMAFSAEHPDLVRKSYANAEKTLERKFGAHWWDKVRSSSYRPSPRAPTEPGPSALTMCWLMLWSWGRCVKWRRSFRES